MSFFDKIKNAIFGNKAHAAPAPTSAAPASAAPAAAAPAAPIDIVPILDHAATLVNFDTNWRVSIVDLMKLCGLDSSLANRKELATELGYTGDMNDSATMNIWLHRQVMNKLAANGGHVPADLKD
jgi:3-oxoacyl-ACP reductase-like protein